MKPEFLHQVRKTAGSKGWKRTDRREGENRSVKKDWKSESMRGEERRAGTRIRCKEKKGNKELRGYKF